MPSPDNGYEHRQIDAWCHRSCRAPVYLRATLDRQRGGARRSVPRHGINQGNFFQHEYAHAFDGESTEKTMQCPRAAPNAWDDTPLFRSSVFRAWWDPPPPSGFLNACDRFGWRLIGRGCRVDYA